jgi:hypothetical protein
MFRNVGQYKPDTGKTPKRKHTEYWTRQKFKIKNDDVDDDNVQFLQFRPPAM